MMGFKSDHDPQGIMNVAADAARIADIKSNPDLAYKYGLDRL